MIRSQIRQRQANKSRSVRGTVTSRYCTSTQFGRPETYHIQNPESRRHLQATKDYLPSMQRWNREKAFSCLQPSPDLLTPKSLFRSVRPNLVGLRVRGRTRPYEAALVCVPILWYSSLTCNEYSTSTRPYSQGVFVAGAWKLQYEYCSSATAETLLFCDTSITVQYADETLDR